MGTQPRARQGPWDTPRCWMGTSPHYGCGGHWGGSVTAREEKPPPPPHPVTCAHFFVGGVGGEASHEAHLGGEDPRRPPEELLRSPEAPHAWGGQAGRGQVAQGRGGLGLCVCGGVVPWLLPPRLPRSLARGNHSPKIAICISAGNGGTVGFPVTAWVAARGGGDTGSGPPTCPKLRPSLPCVSPPRPPTQNQALTLSSSPPAQPSWPLACVLSWPP